MSLENWLELGKRFTSKFVPFIHMIRGCTSRTISFYDYIDPNESVRGIQITVGLKLRVLMSMKSPAAFVGSHKLCRSAELFFKFPVSELVPPGFATLHDW